MSSAPSASSPSTSPPRATCAPWRRSPPPRRKRATPSRCCRRSPCPPRTRCAAPSPGSGSCRRRRHRHHGGASARRGSTISLPPHVQVVVADSDGGDRYAVVDTDQAGAGRPTRPSGPRPQHGLASAGPSPSRHSAAPMPGTPPAPRRACVPPPLVRGELVGGVRLPRRPTARRRARLYRGVRRQRPDHRVSCGLLHRNAAGYLDDVSVIGFDDIPEAGSFLPPLTTVHQDFAEVGRLCVEGVRPADAPRRAGTPHHARPHEAGGAAVWRRRPGRGEVRVREPTADSREPSGKQLHRAAGIPRPLQPPASAARGL